MPSFRDELSINDQEIAAALVGEERRQQDGVELIPSENYTYPEVLELLGSVFTNKYSEGYPGRRYYGGQQYTDKIENLARERACALFRAEHANVQPLSGSPMNQAVYLGLLKPGDAILAMGPVPWRSSHPRLAVVPYGAFIQIHPLQDGPVKRRRDRFQRIARDCA
jgi:glycine hydroxymethyltransferase